MPSNVKDWSGKIEGVDYVVCRHCGHKAVTLVMHLKFSHKTNAEDYYDQFPDAPMLSSICSGNKRLATTRAHKDKPTKGATKMVSCRVCGSEHEVSRFD
jgi:predicted transcriptional regulator